jgi:hypothetical protein
MLVHARMVPRMEGSCPGRRVGLSFWHGAIQREERALPGALELARQHGPYDAFARIDGRHPYRDAVPGGHVDYRARRRRDGELAYFNYGLAREMGLIPSSHPDRMFPALRAAILDAFALVVVNEYDLAHGVRVPARDLLPHPYMATRYLQLQHPGRRGTTSGDGRSIWNGAWRHAGVTWDVSSCGTGVTRLCPATAATRRFYKTGSRTASYGCGTASVEEGLAAAVMSEVLHRNGIPTERVLAVIAFPGGFAVNVRAARNLLRPSHLFAPLKQNDLARLKRAVDYAIARERKNGSLACPRSADDGYRAFAEATARAFGRTAAIFEREYIFCWLDWDGDNVLLDGSIVDYGSVRQFGLYHREYRYDDGPRWSTTIPEQKAKARAIVRCFAQITDALISGKRAPLSAFGRSPFLAAFDAEFVETKDRLLLRHAGFDLRTETLLLARARSLVKRFDRAHRWFEAARSARGRVPVPDGITWDAVYSTRDLLRELPRIYARDPQPLRPEIVLDIAASSYASRDDRRPTRSRRRRAREFQSAYLALVRRAARLSGRSVRDVLADVAARSATINAYARITGDAVTHAAARLARSRKALGPDGLYDVIARFARRQSRVAGAAGGDAPRRPDAKRVFDDLFKLVIVSRDGL